jgi:uncharacterized protein
MNSNYARQGKPNNIFEYKKCISTFLKNPNVLSMDDFFQHGTTTCLEHCIIVSYTSYRLCKFLKLDYTSAARGALLHDLFLYDWHTVKPPEGLHAFSHPAISLFNASKIFVLNPIEKDVILKHMWPLTIRLPRYREALIVCIVDKYCALTETFKFKSIKLRALKVALQL